MYGSDFGKGLVALFWLTCVFFCIIGFTLAWLFPRVWEWVKPFIHAATG